MRLEGGEPLILKTLYQIQGDSRDPVEDFRLAARTSMSLEDIRDNLELLEAKGLIERFRGAKGYHCYLTAKGRLKIRTDGGNQGEQSLAKVEKIDNLKPKNTSLNIYAKMVFDIPDDLGKDQVEEFLERLRYLLLEARYPGEIVLNRIISGSTRIEVRVKYGVALKLLELSDDKLLEPFHLRKVAILPDGTEPVEASAANKSKNTGLLTHDEIKEKIIFYIYISFLIFGVLVPFVFFCLSN